MSHYDCDDCGRFSCAGNCVARSAEKEQKLKEKLQRLALTKEDLALLERAVHVIELTLPETSYAKGIILAELLGDIKKRIN